MTWFFVLWDIAWAVHFGIEAFDAFDRGYSRGFMFNSFAVVLMLVAAAITVFI